MKQIFIKMLHPDFEPFVCQECKKEISLPPWEIKRLCLLSYKELKKENFKGLCPICTKKWLNSQKPIRGKEAVFISVDDFVV